ncbi:hypothetical protein K0U07_00640 [bacterium]|nr:hypothetical protein [bacterium]
MKLVFSFLFLLCSLFAGRIDVILPVHKKDAPNLDDIISAVEERVADIGRIIVVSKRRFTNRAEWVSEDEYPFTIEDVADEIGGEGGIGTNIRRGWYYQQLLKFYAHYVIEDLSEDILILDSDTIPTKPISFFDEDGRVYMDYRRLNYRRSYKRHTNLMLCDSCTIRNRENPVVHHMVFSKTIMDDLFAMVEEKYGKPFWQVFANLVLPPHKCSKGVFYAGASEYMIYYFFATSCHTDKVKKRAICLYDSAASLTGRCPRNAQFMSKHNYDRRE